MLKLFIDTLTFLTVFPIKKSNNIDGKILTFFPLAGTIIGVILYISFVIFNKIFPVSISTFLVLIIYILIADSLHLDGFGDTVDAIYAGRFDKEKFIKVLSDPHIGNFSVIFLILLLLTKLQFLTIICNSSNFGYVTMILLPTYSRWGQVVSCCSGKYLKQEGLGKTFIGQRKIFLLYSTVLLFFTTFLVLFVNHYLNVSHKFILILAIIFLVSYLLTKFFNEKLGGINGDIVGFISEINEIIFLISIYCFAIRQL